MKHHGGKWDAQLHRLLAAVKDAGIAMPAFFRIPNLRYVSLVCNPEDIRGADICTNTTGIAFISDDDWWHNILLKKK